MEHHEQNLSCKLQIDNLSEKIERIEEQIKTYPRMEILMEQMVASSTKTNEVLDKFSDTQSEFSFTLEKVNTNMNLLSVNLKDIKDDVDSLKNERNLNIIEWIKNNFVTIILAGYALYELSQKIIG